MSKNFNKLSNNILYLCLKQTSLVLLRNQSLQQLLASLPLLSCAIIKDNSRRTVDGLVVVVLAPPVDRDLPPPLQFLLANHQMLTVRMFLVALKVVTESLERLT